MKVKLTLHEVQLLESFLHNRIEELVLAGKSDEDVLELFKRIDKKLIESILDELRKDL